MAYIQEKTNKKAGIIAFLFRLRYNGPERIAACLAERETAAEIVRPGSGGKAVMAAAGRQEIGMKLKERAILLKKDIPAVFLALKDGKTPVMAKILAGITVAYALSPVDLIPDFVPGLGYLDDVILLPALIALTVKLIPEDVLRSCREQAGEMWQDGRPKKWYYAIPVAAVWALVIWLIVKALF